MKSRQYTIIIFFVIITVGLSIYSYMGNFDGDSNSAANAAAIEKHDEMDESYFKAVDYYLVDQGKPFLRLESTELTLSKQNTEVVGFNPDGVIYRRDEAGVEEDPIYFTSKNSRVFTQNKELYLQQDVEIKVANSNLKSDKVTIFNSGRHLEADGNVRTQSFDPKTNDQILITSNFALYRPKEQFFEYQRNVKGTIQRKRQYEESVSFTTDMMTLEGLKSEVEMKGNVTFKKGNLDASSNQGTVFLENYNKRLKYYSLSDDVRLQESLLVGGKPMVRKAFAEKLEGLISEKKIILTGLPKVFQEKDVIKGNRITIRENIETVEVDDANTNITLERDKDQNQ
ncbi:LptA/OstA family protein [Bacteriovorax sp. PP10]|uniref:LptA/OstA family protein n=1 Tax=Bacteriovorax antarcticus TaxID=3088717 RepID=A0ABU5VVI1_9BACT|nr:LptA/OstA family protein [Bacteriovorax sp. PP10]MEA9357071.1 LptA/OstA family protein [Bacteriovorax sp. PP10]